MEGNASEKSRRERRKEARVAKKKKKFDSWVHNQQSSKMKRPSSDKVTGKKLDKNNEPNAREIKYSNAVIEGDLEGPLQAKKKVVKSKKVKTKFDEYMKMEMGRGNLSAEMDLKLERELAEKLKVKNGKLRGRDDDLGSLLEGIPSVLDSMGGEDIDVNSLDKSAISKRHKVGILEKEVESEIESFSEDGDSEEIESEIESFSEDGDSEEVESEMESFSEDEYSDMPHSSGEEHGKAKGLDAPKGSRNEKKRTRKTNFEEYLDMELNQTGDFAANKDIELERKLAKKLKVKKGKLQADDTLFMGIHSVLDSLEDPGLQGTEADPVKNLDSEALLKKSGKVKLTEQEQAQGIFSTTHGASKRMKNDDSDVGFEKISKMAPALGSNTKYVAPHLRSSVQNESEEYAKIRKRVRGLLNRLSETNVESITGEISTIFHAVGRTVGSEIIGQEVLSSCAGGPRGSEQYAATFAAFVAGMACLVGIDFGAKLLASLAQRFEMEYLQEDNLSLRNLTLLLCYLYIFGVCTSDLIYDFMTVLSKRLMEVDVSTILTILQTCGMKLRGDDPVGMKNFIQSVQQRVNELKASSGYGQANMNGKRMEFMLETICEIKNNKKRPKAETVQHTRIKKWLQKLRVDDILVRVMKWSKLLDPDKKGQWWLSGDVVPSGVKVEEVANSIDWGVTEAQKMLQLAASQRMNTDARRAIFCVIMSGDDFRDAFAKLLSLDLHGKQDREIMRVLIDCCLQEKVFNKYYTILGYKLCKHNKNHKFTLQYCIWDHYKELETMPLIRSMHLAKFTAEMIASFSLSLAALKAVDLSDPLQLTTKTIMHFRMFFEAVFEFPDKIVWNAFSRIAVTPEYESLRTGIKFFMTKYVISSRSSLEEKFKIAKQALKNAEGQLL